MASYGRICGSTLARAHARSGDRIAIAAYLGGSDAFDQALAEFSEAYADQNERDYDALVQAEKTAASRPNAGCERRLAMGSSAASPSCNHSVE